MQIKEIILGLPVLCFIWWVFAAPVPQQRIERVCEPVHWVGNLATSTTALATAQHTDTSVRWTDKLNYSCQYLVWRLFYQDDYNAAVAAGLVANPAPNASTPTPAQNAAAAVAASALAASAGGAQ
jgi:hypothetical protein